MARYQEVLAGAMVWATPEPSLIGRDPFSDGLHVVGTLALQTRRRPVEAGDPALYRRLPHGFGYLQMHVRVEGIGDELRAGGQGGEDLGGGQLHLCVDLLRPREEGAAEDAGVAEHVVHAPAVGGEGRP